MMKKNVSTLLMALILSALHISAFTTSGNGNTYTLDILSENDDSGVIRFDDGDDVMYMISGTVTIAKGDRFVMDDGVRVEFDDKATLVIEGEADFRLTKGSTFDSASDNNDEVRPVGIQVTNTKGVTPFANCTFYQVGLRNGSTQGMTLSHCAFYRCNGAIGQGALTMGTDGAPFTLTDCHFEENAKAAIAGAANYRNPLVVERCTFVRNGAANGNTPQLNLTVADSVVVRHCTIEGNPENTMVGGIVVANLMSYTGTYTTRIEECRITNCRFGIATYLHQNAYLVNNTLIDNNRETNAMNGGSGINVYDPYQTQYTYVEGNHIEGSLWGITLVGGKEANLGRTDVAATDTRYNPGRNVFKNNGNGGVLYDLYNNSANTVYAQGNIWNVASQTQANIEKVVYHKADNASLGEVVFMPAGDATTISSISKSDAADLEIVDLCGRPVKARGSIDNLPSGIYIVNGHKVIVN